MLDFLSYIILHQGYVVAIAVSLAVIGGVTMGIFKKKTKLSSMFFCGLILFLLAGVTTVFLALAFFMNLLCTLGAMVIFLMADSWIGTSMTEISWTNVWLSGMALIVALAGLVSGLVPAFIRNRSAQ